MKIGPYLEKLEKSKEYAQFRTNYPDNFMVAGFFVIDLEAGANIHQIDFYVPSKKKVAAFTLDGKVQMQLLDLLKADKVPEKLEKDVKIDLDELKGIVLDEMHNRGMSEEIKKLIAILQKIDGKKLWSVNCVLSGMEILKSHVDDSTKTVLKIEKISLVDLMKKIPTQQMPAEMKAPENNEDIKKELEKLGNVEKQIQEAKIKLEKELDAVKKSAKPKNSNDSKIKKQKN